MMWLVSLSDKIILNQENYVNYLNFIKCQTYTIRKRLFRDQFLVIKWNGL